LDNKIWQGTEDERALVRDMAEYAEELVKEFPEVTLRSWDFNAESKNGRWLPLGIYLYVTGPKLAVETFLTRIAVVFNVDGYPIYWPIEYDEAGNVLDKPIKDFTARMRPSAV